ncbi:Translation initiation factor 3 subunit J component [Mortierella sp. GBA43]|nr:Translation initiation factor 3 subunit J component [Mortierella sp. GBA43]
MSDWENEDAIEAPSIPTKKQWDDEDVDEDDVKDEWDASSESEKEEEVKQPVAKPKKMTLDEKIAQRNAEAERKKQAAQEKAAAVEETKEERAQRLQREQQAMIDSDLANAADLFGAVNVSGASGQLETMKPKTKEEFNDFTAALVSLIQKHEKQGLYVSFLEGLFRELSQNQICRDVDVRKFASTLTTVANEKQKAAKDASKTKKKGSAKPSLVANKVNTVVDTRDYSNDYDEFEDFM